MITKALIKGGESLGPLMVGLLAIVVYAGIAVALASRIYRSERVLFAVGGRPVSERRTRPMRTRLTPFEGAALLMVVITLILLVGQPLQAADLILGLLATEYLLVAVPVLLFVKVAWLSQREVFRLRWPGWATMLGAALCGASGWYLIGGLVEHVQQRVLPIPPEVMEMMHRLLVDSDRPLALDLFALRSRSIYPGMLFHLLNNASAVILGRLIGSAATELPVRLYHGLAAGAVFAAGCWLGLRDSRQVTPAPADPQDR